MIPKIIHQILLPHHATPNNHLRDASEWLRATWKRHHPYWEYRLWTDAGELDGKMVCNKLYHANRNPGHRADILRYEILHAIGGVYTDLDTQCFKPFDPLTTGHGRAWAGAMFGDSVPHTADYRLRAKNVEITTLGSEPGVAFYRHLLDTLNAKRAAAGAKFWTEFVPDRSGPFYYSRMLVEAGPASEVTLLPADYFYPTDWRHLTDPEPAVAAKYAAAGSYCRHYWWNAWIKDKPVVHANGRSDPRVGW